MKTPNKDTIDSVLSNVASENEATEVLNWFATDEGSQYLVSRIKKESTTLSKDEIDSWLDHEVPSKKIGKTVLEIAKKRRRRINFYWAAAVIMPFLILSATVGVFGVKSGFFADNTMQEVYVEKGDRMQLVFQDGTKVYLNSDTHLKYPKSFGVFNRKVELTGQAYFEVSKNKLRPFIVDLSGVEVQVLGTSFDVKAYKNKEIQVLLVEGKVLLSDKQDKQYLLSPGKSAKFDRNTGICLISKPENPDAIVAWKNNQLFFTDTPFAEVIEVLSRQYNVNFAVSDKILLQTKFTFSSSKVNLRDVLWDFEKISHFRFTEMNDGTYKVSE